MPKDRGPGKAWRPGPEVDEVAPPVDRPGDRIGYARVSTRGQDLETQERLLRGAGCIEPLYVETISSRQPERPRFSAALAALRPNDILTVTMLDRLGRNTVELITSAQDIEHRGNRLEILQGPLAGIYDPRGAGKIVFATFAAFAEAEREFIRDRTLDGLETATARGRFGGRPRAVDDDVLAVAQSRLRRAEPQSITAIARDLGVGRSTLYRALAHAEAAQRQEGES
ncbi:recombinase family protein [Streptomyces sp. NPDC093990]|uniref:recombinase family protein n=1 Tax=Streptomyces sp. NPDC093990 TaxID=3155306 RepID=UPI003432284B